MCEIDEKGDAFVVKRVLKSVREEWTQEELLELKQTQESTEKESGLHNERGCRKRPTRFHVFPFPGLLFFLFRE